MSVFTGAVHVMEKRSYTHVQKLLPEVQRIVAEGKRQREIVEELGLKNNAQFPSVFMDVIFSWKAIFQSWVERYPVLSRPVLDL